MDKYEYNLKLDQIKTLLSEGKYKDAAEIADTINWNKIKNVNALVKDNIISREEAKTHPERHVLLRAIGVTRTINFEVNKIDNICGKKFLLCTDGLTGTSSDAEILDIIQKSNKEKICTNLISLANEKGGHDNITVMYIEV